MNISVAYGRDLDDSMMLQLQYLEADAYACYENLDNDKDLFIVGVIPSETLKSFKRRMANTLFLMKTVKKNGKKSVIGIACLTKRKKHELHLHTVYVKSHYRCEGIGTALVKEAMKVAKHCKRNLTLGVNPLNMPAISIYRQLGFKFSKGQKITMELKIAKG